MLTQLQLHDVCPDIGASNASMALHIQVVSQSYHNLHANGHANTLTLTLVTGSIQMTDLLYLLCQFPGGSQDKGLASLLADVHGLEDGDSKRGSLPCARLGLSYYIMAWGREEA